MKFLIANERLQRNRAGQVVLQLKSAYKDALPEVVTLSAASPWAVKLPLGKVSTLRRSSPRESYSLLMLAMPTQGRGQK
jgi:hypothetical protein